MFGRFKMNTLFIVFTLALFIIPFSAQAVEVKVVPNPEYPGTNIEMKVGDVLYSSKTLGGSTQIVGHVGIVGPDLLIYHVTPATGVKGGGVGDSINNYMRRHGKGETITIYQYRSGGAKNAAKWAANNYSRVKNYEITFSKLSQIDPNYCSKFLWQAFYYGAGVDVIGKGITDSEYSLVYPFTFTYANFVSRGAFRT